MEHVLVVENIKCGGCANSICQKISALDGVDSVKVEVEAGEVYVRFTEENVSEERLNAVREALLSMGYPESGSVEGMKAAGAKAKSFVSCAIGKLS